jgi:Swt1-like HEPN
LNSDEMLKLFAVSNQLLEHDLDRVEKTIGFDLGRGHTSMIASDDAYYPQIEADIRKQAADMAPHYEVFYSLENTIRRQIIDTLAAVDKNWWDDPQYQYVPQQIKTECESRRQREVDMGLTPRSDEFLDYSTFGELGEIIKKNWSHFGQIFSSPKAVERVMSLLNSIRGPIAHCSPLAEDEIARLRLAVKDWFRLQE